MPRKGENIFKRKGGGWEARYIHHYENGVAKYRYVYGATYMEAKRKRAEDQRVFGMNTKKTKLRQYRVMEIAAKSGIL